MTAHWTLTEAHGTNSVRLQDFYRCRIICERFLHEPVANAANASACCNTWPSRDQDFSWPLGQFTAGSEALVAGVASQPDLDFFAQAGPLRGSFFIHSYYWILTLNIRRRRTMKDNTVTYWI